LESFDDGVDDSIDRQRTPLCFTLLLRDQSVFPVTWSITSMSSDIWSNRRAVVGARELLEVYPTGTSAKYCLIVPRTTAFALAAAASRTPNRFVSLVRMESEISRCTSATAVWLSKGTTAMVLTWDGSPPPLKW
jgi:hypothetical protein